MMNWQGVKGIVSLARNLLSNRANAKPVASLRYFDDDSEGHSGRRSFRRPEASVNQVALLGRVGADPTVMGKNNQYYRLNMVTNDGFRGQNKNWHNIVAFDEYLVRACDTIVKGDKVYVSGNLMYTKSEYQDTGRTFYRTSINADRIVNLSNKNLQQVREIEASSPTRNFYRQRDEVRGDYRNDADEMRKEDTRNQRDETRRDHGNEQDDMRRGYNNERGEVRRGYGNERGEMRRGHGSHRDRVRRDDYRGGRAAADRRRLVKDDIDGLDMDEVFAARADAEEEESDDELAAYFRAKGIQAGGEAKKQPAVTTDYQADRAHIAKDESRRRKESDDMFGFDEEDEDSSDEFFDRQDDETKTSDVEREERGKEQLIYGRRSSAIFDTSEDKMYEGKSSGPVEREENEESEDKLDYEGEKIEDEHRLYGSTFDKEKKVINFEPENITDGEVDENAEQVENEELIYDRGSGISDKEEEVIKEENTSK